MKLHKNSRDITLSTKKSKESYKTQTQRGQNAIIQKRLNEEATKILGETFEDLDKETELEDNKTSFSVDKISFGNEKNMEHKDKNFK